MDTWSNSLVHSDFCKKNWKWQLSGYSIPMGDQVSPTRRCAPQVPCAPEDSHIDGPSECAIVTCPLVCIHPNGVDRWIDYAPILDCVILWAVNERVRTLKWGWFFIHRRAPTRSLSPQPHPDVGQLVGPTTRRSWNAPPSGATWMHGNQVSPSMERFGRGWEEYGIQARSMPALTIKSLGVVCLRSYTYVNGPHTY